VGQAEACTVQGSAAAAATRAFTFACVVSHGGGSSNKCTALKTQSVEVVRPFVIIHCSSSGIALLYSFSNVIFTTTGASKSRESSE
jgi:hypothetical protein